MPQVQIADHEHKELLGFKAKFLALVEGKKEGESAPLITPKELAELKTKAANFDAMYADLVKFDVNSPDKLEAAIAAKEKLAALEASGNVGLAELQTQIDELQDALDDQTTETKKMQKAYDEAVEENGTLTAKVKELEAAAEKAAG